MNLVLCMAVVLLSSSAALADPMRPFVTPAANGASAALAGARLPSTSPVDAAGNPALAPLPALRAIRVDADGRSLALFGEQWLAVGAKLPGHASLAAIGANQVDIQQGKTRRTLSLLPPLLASNDAHTPAVGSPPSSPSTNAMQIARRARDGSTTHALAPPSLRRAATLTTP